MSLWTPSSSSDALHLPGSPDRRLISRPDLRHSIVPRQSGRRLFESEVDYDDLEVIRQWREYEPSRPDEVRYFMMEVRQQNPGEGTAWRGYKAVRFARLTRVPRWLRQQGGGVGRAGVSQMAYVLAALREQGVLFVQLITKSPDSQLIFAYGVQALGSTEEEARARVDEAYASLVALLDGTYQQIEYAPLTLAEGERIVRQQSTWNNIAVARGRPMINNESVGASALLDGNRTDTENTHNQMEAFIRGMSESRKGFMLTVITVPLAVTDMNIAIANIARHVSTVRSETHGQRAVSAGAAIPLSVGQGEGIGQSDSHSTSTSFGESTSDSTSLSESLSNTVSTTEGVSNSTSNSATTGTSTSSSTATGVTEGTSATASSSSSEGVTVGNSATNTVGSSATSSEGTSATNTVGTSQTNTSTNAASVSSGSNWSDSTGSSSSQSLGFSTTDTTSSSMGAGLVGMNTSTGTSQSDAVTNSETSGFSSTSSAGGSNSQSVSTSAAIAQGVTSSAAVGASQTQSAGVSQSSAVGTSQSATATSTTGQSASVSNSTSTTSTSGTSQSNSATSGTTSGTSSSNSSGTTSGTTTGATSSTGTNQQMADAYAVAMSRQASHTGSLGVVPSFGVSVSKQTLDAGKQLVGDVLEETMRRYVDGIEGGAFLYQMFLTAEDSDTLHAGAALLKSAFWGPGSKDRRLAQPFHVVADLEGAGLVDKDDEDGEKDRLLTHALAFSSYRRREPTSELIEPFLYSSYVTCGELSTFARPPVAESIGLLAVHDSAPVMAMPGDREDRDLTTGFVFNGERGRVSNTRMGLDIDELTHTLVTGVTGSGKTTTLMRMLSEICNYEREVTVRGEGPISEKKNVGAGILAIDWMRNMRDLGSLVEPVSYNPETGERTGRYQFFSVRDRELGAFTWNPMALPTDRMNPVEWLNATADNMVASWGLGEFGRSLIADYLDQLYTANRLEEAVLIPESEDGKRAAVVLPAVDRASIPADGFGIDGEGNEVANVYSCPALSRLIGVEHLAMIVYRNLQDAATVEGGRQGTSVRDRLQSLWRRVSYFAPRGQLTEIITCDTSLNERRTLTVSDLVDPEAGLITVIETDGLDLANRRFILGSLVNALYRAGLQMGEGCFNQGGQGPGLFVVLEEAHELFGSQGDDDDRFSSATRTALYESLHRRCRALGIRLIDVVQNPADVPEAITSNTSTVFVHRTYDKGDRDRVFSLLNWSNQIGQQLREYRFLGELPVGHVICRLHARNHYLEGAPIHFVAEPAAMGKVTNQQLELWAANRRP